MLGSHFISQKPNEAQAWFAPKSPGFFECPSWLAWQAQSQILQSKSSTILSPFQLNWRGKHHLWVEIRSLQDLLVRNQLHLFRQQYCFHFQNYLIQTCMDRRSALRDTSPFRITVSAAWLWLSREEFGRHGRTYPKRKRSTLNVQYLVKFINLFLYKEVPPCLQ